eukprot:TRINITY_DN7329_c0_g1_i1.p1 TRINITY_DN7329_c0_g1~~TRINITY_DN7329_c0_g1_i1.p1  ORF type:complete len:440 (+),score=153.02 TRINITY_DN7329_c0_g1_i1:158-1477(+)
MSSSNTPQDDEKKTTAQEEQTPLAPGDVLKSVSKNLERKNRPGMELGLAQAKKLLLDPKKYPVLRKAEEFIRMAREIENVSRSKDTTKMKEVIAKATDAKFAGPELDRCIILVKEIEELGPRAAQALKRIEIDEMKIIVQKAEELEFVNEDVLKIYDLLRHKTDDKLLQMQLQAAFADNDFLRAEEISMHLKDKFFAKMGDMFVFSKFPKLKTPSEFAEAKGMLASAKEKDELRETFLRHTTVPLHTSLTTNCKESSAKKLHKHLLRIMGDRKSKKNMDDVIAEVQSTGITRRDVREEIYCQLVKQLTKNPSESSIEKGWNMLHICLDSFPPGEALENYLQCWIRSNAPEPNKTLQKMHKTMTQGNDPVLQGIVRVRGESKISELDIISGNPERVKTLSPSNSSNGSLRSMQSLEDDDLEEDVEPVGSPKNDELMPIEE